MRTTSGPNPLKTTTRARLIIVALVALLASTGAALSTTEQQTEGGSLTAEFKTLGPITSQATVKIAGVIVGITGMPTVDPDRKLALLPMDLQPNAFPIHTDAKATVRQISLIGEKFIDLDPGTPSAPLLQSGGTIPASQTDFAEDYQNLVQALNDPTAAGLSSIVRTFGEGIKDRGPNVQKILQELGPTFRDTDKLVQALNRQNGLLGDLVDQIQPVTNGLAADKGKTLDRTIDSATNLLGTTAVNEQNLRATLQELPTTLGAAQRTLDTLTGTAREGEQTLRALRPTSDNLAAISRELQRFTDSANPALKSANPLLDRANELLDEARPLASELRRTGDPLYDTIHGARPVVDSVRRHLGGPYGAGPDPICPGSQTWKDSPDCKNPRIKGALGFLHNWALVTNQGDALQHYFRVFVVLDDQVGEVGPLAAGAGAAARNAVAGKTVTRGDSKPGGSATGLNPTQERNALGTLMGGR